MTASPSPRPQQPSTTQPSTTQPTDQQTAPKDSPKQLFGVYIKGMAMGAADIVPGVSGGTIALIAGIYERLINALGSIGPSLWTVFRQEGGFKGFAAVWRQVDATFFSHRRRSPCQSCASSCISIGACRWHASYGNCSDL